MTGVDAAEQRLDEPVHDLLAEPLLDQPADADVLVVDAGRRERGLHGDSGQPGRGEHAGGGELLGLGRHAHEGRRHRAHPAPRPQARGDGGGVHEPVAEPDLAGQGDRLGAAVQHRLGTDVHDDPADLGALQLAADLRRRLEHRHVDVRSAASYRSPGRQPGDAAADHDDTWAPGAGLWGHRSQVGKDSPARWNRAPSAASQVRQEQRHSARNGVGDGRHRTDAFGGRTDRRGGRDGGADGVQRRLEQRRSVGLAGGSGGHGAGAGRSADRAAGANRSAPRTKAVIRTGEISLTSKDLGEVQGRGRRPAAFPRRLRRPRGHHQRPARAASSARPSCCACRWTRSTRHARR